MLRTLPVAGAADTPAVVTSLWVGAGVVGLRDGRTVLSQHNMNVRSAFGQHILVVAVVKPNVAQRG